jgi:hypothetical protein
VPADVPAALADLAAAFAALGVRWYVFGAQAVIAAGVPRLTADIDVTVELPRGGPRALIAALARAGIALRPVGDVATFIAKTRVIPAIHVASQLPIDVVLAGPGLEEDMLARARRRPVGGIDVPFVDTPDLIALKILAGRDKDLEDVRALGRAGLPGRSLEVARQQCEPVRWSDEAVRYSDTPDKAPSDSPWIRWRAACCFAACSCRCVPTTPCSSSRSRPRRTPPRCSASCCRRQFVTPSTGRPSVARPARTLTLRSPIATATSSSGPDCAPVIPG